MSLNEDRDYFYEQQAAQEEFIEEISRQAIYEFTNERLQSLYVKNPDVMVKAIDLYKKGKALQEIKYYSAAVVFFMSAIENFLKLTLIKPVVYGLVHHETLAGIIVEQTMRQQSNFDSYRDLLKKLFSTLTNENTNEIYREGASKNLLKECEDLQKLRNTIIHQGDDCEESAAKEAYQISEAVFKKIVMPMLHALNLTLEGNGVIKSF